MFIFETCFLAFFMHLASTMYVENKGYNTDIIDNGFNIVPKLNLPNGLVDFPAFLYPLITLLLSYLVSKPQDNKAARFLWQASIIMMLRSLTIVLTILPSTKPCATDYTLLRGGCNDKIFSGHIAYITLSALHIHDLQGTILQFSAIVVEGFLLIGSREHYTVDVVLGVVIAVLVYQANTPKTPTQPPSPET